MMALSMDQAEQDMRGAVEFLASQPGVQGPGVGAVGFCLGEALPVGRGHLSTDRRCGHVLLRDAPRQATRAVLLSR